MARTTSAVATSIKSKLNGAAVEAVALADDAKLKLEAKLAQARKEAKAIRAERDAEHARASAAIDELNARKAAEPSHKDAVQDRLASALDEFMLEFQAPSWKRMLAGACLAIAISAAAGWCIAYIVNALVAAAIMLTGSVFLGWCILVLGFIMSGLSGFVLGSKAFGYVASGKIDEHASGIKNKVTGWFKSKPIVEFTGAHAA